MERWHEEELRKLKADNNQLKAHVDISVGWKPLNLERYDGTIDPDKHLDGFQT
ncbi:hypothetical protein JHK82_027897 [Glycine max]|nr:hypothetical protein JHK87_027800 [Glycine soja]KAG4997124.1 hypothetical protein JHK85_028563 [Glycine max]KAG5003888.1 hypothetical protein JHK86_028027 [Glycine max]KAG5127062.1 hypothetical protein JHK82_027897 [Glycine max]KAG5151675.1 hypothetical protein JHK84_028147 [Glycine max]